MLPEKGLSCICQPKEPSPVENGVPEIRVPDEPRPRKKESVPEIAVQEPEEAPQRRVVPIVKEPTPEPNQNDSLVPGGATLEPGTPSPGGSRRGSVIITADEVGLRLDTAGVPGPNLVVSRLLVLSFFGLVVVGGLSRAAAAAATTAALAPPLASPHPWQPLPTLCQWLPHVLPLMAAKVTFVPTHTPLTLQCTCSVHWQPFVVEPCR